MLTNYSILRLQLFSSVYFHLSINSSPFLFGCALELCRAVAPNSVALSHSRDPDHAPQSSYNIEDDIISFVSFFP